MCQKNIISSKLHRSLQKNHFETEAPEKLLDKFESLIKKKKAKIL